MQNNKFIEQFSVVWRFASPFPLEKFPFTPLSSALWNVFERKLHPIKTCLETNAHFVDLLLYFFFFYLTSPPVISDIFPQQTWNRKILKLNIYLSNLYKVCDTRVMTDMPISRHMTVMFWSLTRPYGSGSSSKVKLVVPQILKEKKNH